MAEQGKPKFAFFEGKIVPIEDAKISVMSHAFNYGTGVFGGLRGYWNDDENQLFVIRPHKKHLLNYYPSMRQSKNKYWRNRSWSTK